MTLLAGVGDGREGFRDDAVVAGGFGLSRALGRGWQRWAAAARLRQLTWVA